MRFRSTGLGKTELEAELASIEPKGDLLILHVRTTNPVRWHIRAGIQRKDIPKLIRLMFSFNLIKYFFGFLNPKSPGEPTDF